VEIHIKTLATKDDIAILKEDIAKVDLDLSNRIGDMIKWMFFFWDRTVWSYPGNIIIAN